MCVIAAIPASFVPIGAVALGFASWQDEIIDFDHWRLSRFEQAKQQGLA